jgi:hypothetical protein
VQVTQAAEALSASRKRDFSALTEEDSLEFILGPHRKTYLARDLPMKFWLRRLAGQEKVSDLEVLSASLRVSEEELLDVAEVGTVETARASMVLIDHFLAQSKNVRAIVGMLRNPELISVLYQTMPRPSVSASEPSPDTPSEDSSI